MFLAGGVSIMMRWHWLKRYLSDITERERERERRGGRQAGRQSESKWASEWECVCVCVSVCECACVRARWYFTSCEHLFFSQDKTKMFPIRSKLPMPSLRRISLFGFAWQQVKHTKLIFQPTPAEKNFDSPGLPPEGTSHHSYSERGGERCWIKTKCRINRSKTKRRINRCTKPILTKDRSSSPSWIVSSLLRAATYKDKLTSVLPIEQPKCSTNDRKTSNRLDTSTRHLS